MIESLNNLTGAEKLEKEPKSMEEVKVELEASLEQLNLLTRFPGCEQDAMDAERSINNILARFKTLNN